MKRKVKILMLGIAAIAISSWSKCYIYDKLCFHSHQHANGGWSKSVTWKGKVLAYITYSPNQA